MDIEFDYIVDLSNVCRSVELGAPNKGASLKCLSRLEKAISKSLNGRTPMLMYVADHNLWGLLESSNGSGEVQDWKRRKARLLLEDAVADHVILRIASTNAIRIISGDNFRGHRRNHPWLQGNSESVFGWESINDEVILVPRTLEVLSEAQISQHSEVDSMKTMRLDPSIEIDREILESLYQCENFSCDLRRTSPSYLPVPPNRNRKRREKLECPNCQNPVRELGPIGKVAQLKFRILGTGKSGRITFRINTALTVGRNHFIQALSDVTQDDRELLSAVSGNHLQVFVSDSGVQVADNSSTNGTTIFRSTRPGILDSPTIIGQKMVGLNHGDKLHLGEVVEITRSGRKYGYANILSSSSEGSSVHTKVREP